MNPGNFAYFLPKLVERGVDFILIGGGAAIAHGLARTTYDVDIVYNREISNLERLVEALQGIDLYYRGAPPGLPFLWDIATLSAGLNFTLTSTRGDIDLLGQAAGDGTWSGLQQDVELMQLYDHPVRVVTLSRLIELKQAAGRPKDFEIIAELQTLQSERGSNES